MPLNLSGLQTDLTNLAASPPATVAAAASGWAAAMGAYAAAIVPASTAVAAAQAALDTALQSAFTARPDAAAALETAFAAFATTIAAGMLPLWTGTPPPGAVGFAGFFAASPSPATHAAAGSQLGASIDTWMKTGTAVLVAPPNTPVNWS